MQIEEAVCGGYASAFHFHATLPGMLGTTLIRDEAVQVGEPREKRLLAATGMIEGLHHEEVPVDGVMGVIEQRCWSRASAALRARHTSLPSWPETPGAPARHWLPHCVRDVVRKASQPLTQGKHAHACALSCPVPQGVELGAERLTERGRDGHEFLRRFEERLAQAGPQAHSPETAFADFCWCCRSHR